MACRDIDLVLYLQTKQLVDSGASFAARSLVHFFTGCSKEVGRWGVGEVAWTNYCLERLLRRRSISLVPPLLSFLVVRFTALTGRPSMYFIYMLQSIMLNSI